ncbi:ParB N-terminal domain-containing protein [Lentzea sp. JNUCC 0626]|uniref:ParB N-terminal domain-containing protein n=1 Tax=Lentzea sp. JNUCC 0626 TaxID=3367513 RepID=UPI003748DE24
MPVPIHDLTTTREPVASLHTYFRNPRRGNVDLIAQSLVVNGQYRPVVANKGTHTGRAREVLAGNHTLVAARDKGWPDIAVCWVDVDEDQAARIVAADNRTADVGDYDMGALAELLDGLDDLAGTGYTDADLQALQAVLDAPADVADLHEKYGDPDDAVFHPEIRIKVTPDLFDRWRNALEHYEGADDVAKLGQLLDDVEVMHG